MAFKQYQSNLSLRIPAKLRARIDDEAAREGTTVTRWVRHALEAKVKRKGQKELKYGEASQPKGNDY